MATGNEMRHNLPISKPNRRCAGARDATLILEFAIRELAQVIEAQPKLRPLEYRSPLDTPAQLLCQLKNKVRL